MTTPRDDDGFIALWVLGVAVMVLFVGGLTLDFWRVVAAQRDVAAAVDGAAVAGSSGLDEAAFRGSGGRVVRLDPERARELAAENLGSQPNSDRLVDVAIDASAERVSVEAGRQVEFTLLKVFLGREAPFVVRTTSTADARRSG